MVCCPLSLPAMTLLSGQVWYFLVAWVGHYFTTVGVANTLGLILTDRVSPPSFEEIWEIYLHHLLTPLKGFHGSTGNTVVYRAFEWKFLAKKIRIYVRGWYIWPCMRIELYHTGKVVWRHPRSDKTVRQAASRSKDGLVNN